MSIEKLKKFYKSFFDRLELCTTNFVSNIMERHHVRAIMKKEDKVSSDYKKEIKNYWKKYSKIKIYWHKLYSSRNGIKDVRYIPEDLYYTKIDQYFNNRKFGWGVNDKNYYSIWFNDIKQPKTLVRIINGIYYNENYTIIEEAKAVSILNRESKFIIKPSIDSGKSKGIVFFNKDKESISVEELIKKLPEKNYVIQEIIKQHHELSCIHESSINTIRVMSIILNNKVEIVSSVLRMGVNGSNVDNASAGGITCGIRKDGTLNDYAFKKDGTKLEKHPQGYVFKDKKIPSYFKAIELVKAAHEKLAHFRLVSWDIAIGENGEPILIEANMRKGGATIHQFNNGPLFGELTDKVLDEVFISKGIDKK